MTAPTLADTLRALSAACPGRVARLENWPESWWAVWWDDPDNPEEGSGFLSLGHDDAPNLARLEYALREECGRRGWGINMYLNPSSLPAAEVFYGGGGASSIESAATPAHALALALLAALKATQSPESSDTSAPTLPDSPNPGDELAQERARGGGL